MTKRKKTSENAIPGKPKRKSAFSQAMGSAGLTRPSGDLPPSLLDLNAENTPPAAPTMEFAKPVIPEDLAAKIEAAAQPEAAPLELPSQPETTSESAPAAETKHDDDGEEWVQTEWKMPARKASVQTPIPVMPQAEHVQPAPVPPPAPVAQVQEPVLPPPLPAPPLPTPPIPELQAPVFQAPVLEAPALEPPAQMTEQVQQPEQSIQEAPVQEAPVQEAPVQQEPVQAQEPAPTKPRPSVDLQALLKPFTKDQISNPVASTPAPSPEPAPLQPQAETVAESATDTDKTHELEEPHEAEAPRMVPPPTPTLQLNEPVIPETRFPEPPLDVVAAMEREELEREEQERLQQEALVKQAIENLELQQAPRRKTRMTLIHDLDVTKLVAETETQSQKVIDINSVDDFNSAMHYFTGQAECRTYTAELRFRAQFTPISQNMVVASAPVQEEEDNWLSADSFVPARTFEQPPSPHASFNMLDLIDEGYKPLTANPTYAQVHRGEPGLAIDYSQPIAKLPPVQYGLLGGGSPKRPSNPNSKSRWSKK